MPPRIYYATNTANEAKEKGEINKMDYQRVNYYHSALCKKVKNRTYNKRNFEQKFQ